MGSSAIGIRAAFCGAFAAIAMVAGCRLVDQSSFGGTPRGPAPSELAAAFASDGRLPLLVIRPDDSVPYQDALHAALDAAEVRNGAARFRLESIVPAAGDTVAQSAALDAITVTARQVLDDMGLHGITPDRVALTARSDPHLTRREIRLYQI